MKTCVCLQHVPFEGPGYLARVLDELGFQIARRLVPVEGLPESAGDFLLVMGGPMSVNDSDHWIAQETEFIRKAVEAGTPYLGICLGSQFLAKAMGGNVVRGAAPEFGMTALRQTAEGAADRTFRLFPPSFEAFEWHGEGITLPAGAARLAESALFPVQALRVGARAYGFLFHIEIEPDGVAALCENCESDLIAARVAKRDVQHISSPHFQLMQSYLRRFMAALLA